MSESVARGQEAKGKKGGPGAANRPPFLAITFFISFTLLLLWVVTYRQVREAERDRLRLLAGFGVRIESTVEELARRFLAPVVIAEQDVIAGRKAPCVVPGEILKHVPKLRGTPLPAAKASDDPVELKADAGKVFLTYRNEAPPGCASCPDPPKESLCLYSRAVHLRSVFETVSLPQGFDKLLLATADGQVFFSHGEPELRVTHLAPLLQAAGDQAPASLLEVFGGGRGKGGKPAAPGSAAGAGALLRTSTARTTKVADVSYRAFFQPITIDLPRLVGEKPPQPRLWLAAGLVDDQALLSASYTSSPVLLVILIAIFPLALLIWPFAKLALVAKRQRLTRVDVGALAFSTVFGLSTLTLLVFGVSLLASLEDSVDAQLEKLSKTVEASFRAEMEDAYCQIKAVDRWKKNGSRGQSVSYAVFHSLDWIDEKGRQSSDKIATPGHSSQPIRVEDRIYFKCASGRSDSPLRPRPFVRSEYPAAALCSEGPPYHRRIPEDLCLQSILSRESGEDEAVIALASERPGFPVVAMSTTLHALAFPVMPPEFGFAIVDADGDVMFHADRSRNTTENFLKGAHEDRVLESLLRERRKGLLDASYWGAPHRLYVRPLQGLPWSLVTFRSTADLGLRAFMVAHDFLNPFLIYLTLTILGIAVAVYLMPRNYLENLWPYSHFTPVYREMTLFAILATAAFGLVLAWGEIQSIFVVSFVLPATAVAYYIWRIERRQKRVEAERAAAAAEPEAPAPVQEAPEPRTPLFRPGDGLYAAAALVMLLALWLAASDQGEGRFGLAVLGIALAVIPAAAAERKWRPQPRTKWRLWPVLLLSVALPASIAWARPDIEVVFTVLVVALAVPCFELNQHRFVGRQRRWAFLFALSSLLFVVGVLPALGFMALASSRQTQFIVMDTQLGLARAAEAREERLEGRNQELRKDDGLKKLRKSLGLPAQSDEDATLYTSQLDRMTREYQLSFLDEAQQLGTPRPRFSWPDAIEKDGFEWMIARILSGRLVAIDSFTSQASSVDMSRFEIEWGDWKAFSDSIEGTLPQGLGLEPHSMSSSYLRRLPGSDDLLQLKWASLSLCVLALILMPVLLAYLIAHKLLLVTLVQSGSSEEDKSSWTIQGIVEAAAESTEKNRPARILLLTRIPELALRSVADAVVTIRYSEIPEVQPAPGGKPIALTHFDLDLSDAAAAHKRADAFQKFERDCSERPLIIVSRRDPRDKAGSEATDAVRTRWEGLLASFNVRFGRDAGEEPSKYRQRIKGLIRVAGIEKNHKERLENLIVEECGYTQRLQEIGIQVAQDLHPESFTVEETIAKVTLLARSYYRSIWDGCSTDEKLVLVRLAEDGLVNPKNFDHLLELLQKGLVRRDPALRVMNRSFGQFVLRSVNRAELQEWEDAGGVSAWTVAKWLLPLPLLLFGGFLFVTQRESLSNALGLVVALGSLTPIFINLYSLFQQGTVRTQPAGR